MPIKQEGSNVVVKGHIAGSVFPTSEKDTNFPVLVDGSDQPARIEGALYGRSLELRGDVLVEGPVVARGDLRIDPRKGRVQLRSGLTINGSLNCHLQADAQPMRAVQNASLIIKGDLVANQNIALKNAVIFGSVRAVNCTLENCVVLGTCIVEERLTVRMSSLGGYASREVSFEGACMMIHALGESLTQPVMAPYEAADGTIQVSDVRYYPAIRKLDHLMNLVDLEQADYPDYSLLSPNTDWLESPVTPNAALDELHAESLDKWVLSIGGRIGDVTVISSSIDAMTAMLKVGFEYEHYHPQRRQQFIERLRGQLTSSEQWVLESVCPA